MIKRRTQEWIEREYGAEKWSRVLAQIKEALAQPEPELPRILSHLTGVNERVAPLQQSEIVLSGKRIQCLSRYAKAAFYASIAAEVGHMCGEETDAVLELGSGWGLNLFNVWLGQGPKNAKYFAFEYTRTGRECAELLSTIVPNMKLFVGDFDLYSPTFAGIPKDARHIVVFSVHAIEQIPEIDIDLFRALVALAPRITGIHFEPIGWQMPKNVREPSLSGSSKQYAEKNDYNRNLWEVLNRAQAEGLLTIENVVPEAQSINPDNAVSIVVWNSIPDR